MKERIVNNREGNAARIPKKSAKKNQKAAGIEREKRVNADITKERDEKKGRERKKAKKQAKRKNRPEIDRN